MGFPAVRFCRQPKAADFDALPACATTRVAGLLLTTPELVALDLPGLVEAAGYPGSRGISAASSILSLLALKLTGIRRVSHATDLAADPAAALFAGGEGVTQDDRVDVLLLPAVPRQAAEVPGRLVHGHAESRA